MKRSLTIVALLAVGLIGCLFLVRCMSNQATRFVEAQARRQVTPTPTR